MAHRIKRYRMDFESKGAFTATALVGMAFFLRAVHYFGFAKLEMVAVGELILYLILPMVLEAGLMILIRGIRLNQTLVYGILGAIYCLLLMVQAVQYGDVLRTVLGIGAYVICGGLLVVVSLGLLSKGIAVTACAMTAVVRLIAFDLKRYILALDLLPFMLEAASLFVIMSLACIAMAMREPKD